MVLPEHVYEPVAGISWQLLWFLGAYVLVLAAVPLLARITTTARLAAAVVGGYAAVAVVDAIRINVHGASAVGYLNMVAWLIPGMLGGGLPPQPADTAGGSGRRGADDGRQRGAGGVRAVRTEPCRHRNPTAQEHDAAVAPVDRTRNHDVRVGNCRGTRDRPLGATASGVAAGRDRQHRCDDAVSLAYPAATGSAPGVRLPRSIRASIRTTPGFIVLSVAQLLIMAAVVAVVFVALRPLENNPLPLWDGGLVAAPGASSAAVGVLLCVAGAATLASAGWGLKDQGLIWCGGHARGAHRRAPAR